MKGYGEAVADAKVTAVVGTEEKTDTTKSSGKVEGRFEIKNIPVTAKTSYNSTIPVYIEKEGYITASSEIMMPAAQDNLPVLKRLGKIGLSKPTTLKARVIDPKGDALANATVFANQNGTNPNFAGAAAVEPWYNEYTSTRNMNSTNANGTTQLKLARVHNYNLYALALDSDQDGKTDYVTTPFSDNVWSPLNPSDLVSIAMDPIGGSSENVFVVAGGLPYIPGSYAEAGVNATTNEYTLRTPGYAVDEDGFTFVFNYPVKLDTDRITYQDYLQDPADYQQAGPLPAVTEVDAEVSLDNATNTVLTVTPKNDFSANHYYDLTNLISSNDNKEFDDGSATFYVADTSDSGFSSLDDITLDNYTNSTAPLGDMLYLQTPEYVEGSLRVVNSTNGTDTHWNGAISDNATSRIIYTTADNENIGASEGINAELGMNATKLNIGHYENGDEVTLDLKLWDAEGNKVMGTKTFEVQ